MRRLWLCSGLLAAALAVACKDDVCQEAFDKMEDCQAQLNCNRLDPLARTDCEQSKRAWAQYSGNETLYLTACSSDGELETEAKKIRDCALNPQTCTCR